MPVEIEDDPALVPVLALFQGDETWLVAAGVFDGGITLWCHRPQLRAPRLTAPGFALSLIDDLETRYAATGGGGGMEGRGQEVYRFDFAPRPPPGADRITALGQFDTGLAISVGSPSPGHPGCQTTSSPRSGSRRTALGSSCPRASSLTPTVPTPSHLRP